MTLDSTRLEPLLLASLEAGPAHGYHLIERLRERSGGRFDLPEGSVYPALHRLEQRGLLTSAWESHAGRRRRVYRLSERGLHALHAARAEWRRFSQAFSNAMNATPGGAA